MAVPRLRDILHGHGCTALMSSDSSGFSGTNAAPESPPVIHPALRTQRQPALALPLLRRVALIAPLHEQRPNDRLKEGHARSVIRREREPARGGEGESDEKT